ncbi:MAG: PEP-CTERM sorting domain-containing protein [Phycisphaerae bacterium]|nr:PEP-CTERM sorting domain-containing protein [Phycisphaerae bacterium]MDP7287380.1 PEP-CTERM sorting domain-containing protein [Phycisphaerae bacterium]
MLDNPLVSATLRLQRYGQVGSIDIEFYDVGSAVSTLVSGHNAGDAGGQSIFQDLGAGTSYGQSSVSWTGASTDVLEFSLNSSALADITSGAGGLIAIGVTRTGGDPQSHNENYLFGLSNTSGVQELVLVTTPEPAILSLLALGVLAVLRKRRKQ